MDRLIGDKMNAIRDELQAHAKTQYNKPFGAQDYNYELMDKYDRMKAAMINSNWWPEWCEKQAFAQSHTAIDYYA